MSLYSYSYDVARRKLGGPGYPLRLAPAVDGRQADDLRPGDAVSHWIDGDSFGTVIARAQAQVTVLWSTPPRKSGFTLAKARQLGRSLSFPSSVASSLMVVQPMPDPPAACFYFDPDGGDEPVTT